MGNNIISVETLNTTARMRHSDATELLARLSDMLPETCFLRSLVGYEPDADGYVSVTRLDWTGIWSGNTYYAVFEQVAACIAGRIESILTWDDGETTGLRVVDGKMERPNVLRVLSRSRFQWDTSIDAHRAACDALADVLASGDAPLQHTLRHRLDSMPARTAMLMLASTDDGSPITFESRFNNGRGGATISIAGYMRFVEDTQARELARALDPGRLDVQGPALKQAGQP